MSDTDPLLQVAISKLASAFLAEVGGDHAQARLAARAAILACNPTTGAEVLLAAQFIGFGVAALAASAHAAADPSEHRAHLAAISLGRAAARCQRALASRSKAAKPRPQTAPPGAQTAMPQSQAAQSIPQIAQPVPQAVASAWAAAFADVAAEMSARPQSPTEQQHIAALADAARALSRDAPPQR